MLKHLLPRRTKTSVPIVLVEGRTGLKKWLAKQPQTVKKWLAAIGYKADGAETCLVPNRDGSLRAVILAGENWEYPWLCSKLPMELPSGRYYFDAELTEGQANSLAIGWALGCYRFTRYKARKPSFAELVWPTESDQAFVEAIVNATALGRDLVSTPAEDMGPEELEAAARTLAEQHGVKVRTIVGQDLLKKNYPAIHAVGRASSRAPRLIDFTWGKKQAPKVTLVGKGVCFDSGGLDIKSADGMKLMKKDMGGAGTVLSVASAVMALELPICLRVMIPAVENSISGNAMRPLDVLDTRKGMTVEVGHTDAEGRLILSDALFEADEDQPDLLVDIATLTGAARVALGTSLPALFAAKDSTANALLSAGRRTADPLWRMPLHRPYRRLLNSKVADINNVSTGGYGGAITAALFLREFVSKDTDWMHIDTMAYNLDNKPGRPAGGEVLGVRALVEMLRQRYGGSTED